MLERIPTCNKVITIQPTPQSILISDELPGSLYDLFHDVGPFLSGSSIGILPLVGAGGQERGKGIFMGRMKVCGIESSLFYT